MRSRIDKEKELQRTKRFAIKAAYELGYFRMNPNIENEINKAETIIAVDRIMRTHRRAS